MRTREPSKTIVDTATWLTANQVVDMLGVAHDTVKQWERKGLLHPGRGRRVLSNGASREVRVYDPHEVAGIPRRRTVRVPNDPGELAARAFELMEQGKSLREVVVDLREAPAKVAELHEQWLNLGGSDVVIGRAAADEIVGLVGPFDGVAGLIERLRETVALVEDLRRQCSGGTTELLRVMADCQEAVATRRLSDRMAWAAGDVVRAATRWVEVEGSESPPYEGVPPDPIRDRAWLEAMATLRESLVDYQEVMARTRTGTAETAAIETEAAGVGRDGSMMMNGHQEEDRA
jgi:hypothetical protein